MGFTSWLCYCSDVVHRRPTKLCTSLAVSWACTLYIHIRGFCPDRILPGANFTLRPSLAFSYNGSITARHSTSGHQPNFARHGIRNGITELSQRVAIAFSIGPHSGFFKLYIYTSTEHTDVCYWYEVQNHY